VLPHLDFTLLRHRPKILVGFSDITAVLSEGLKQCGFPMIHGPVVTSLARASTRTLESLFCALTEPFSGMALDRGVTLRRGRVAGVLKGGNLATLVSMVGTRYAPDFTDSILFLEDTGEPAYKIDRMLTQLCLAGCLAGVRGVLLGNFDRCGDVSRIYDIVVERFDDPMVPILAGLDAGHGETNLCLPLGARLVLDADRHTLGTALPIKS
jgi:muramoyltetrapeptide carboxypeptidase